MPGRRALARVPLPMLFAVVVSIVADGANDTPPVLVHVIASVLLVVQSPDRLPLVMVEPLEKTVRLPDAGAPVVETLPPPPPPDWHVPFDAMKMLGLEVQPHSATISADVATLIGVGTGPWPTSKPLTPNIAANMASLLLRSVKHVRSGSPLPEFGPLPVLQGVSPAARPTR